jgi:hypothetical protein
LQGRQRDGTNLGTGIFPVFDINKRIQLRCKGCFKILEEKSRGSISDIHVMCTEKLNIPVHEMTSLGVESYKWLSSEFTLLLTELAFAAMVDAFVVGAASAATAVTAASEATAISSLHTSEASLALGRPFFQWSDNLSE